MSKAVITIHGYLSNVKDFGRLYDYLDFYDEVKAVKIPGHNDKIDMRKFTVNNTIDAVLSAYDELSQRHETIDVVGFSMGGALTSWLCALRKVNRAVVFAPANKYFNFNLPFDAVKFYGGLSYKSYKDADGDFKSKMSTLGKALSPYKDNLVTSVKLAWELPLQHFTPHTYTVFSKLIKLCNQAVQDYAPVKTPVLVIWGRLDELVPRKTIDFWIQHFTNCQTKIYEDIGHPMLYTNRDHLLIRDAVEFLSEGQIVPEVPPKS